MALEIEWKFLVTRLPAAPDRLGGRAVRIEQGYFSAAGGPAVRVRLKDGKGSLDVKAEVPGTRAAGSPQVCREYCYPIPAAEAAELLALAPWRVTKTRYVFADGIELDVFDGPHAGLVLAELEIPAPCADETQATCPDGSRARPVPPAPPAGWEWRDVSSDLRYVNRALAEHGVPDAR